MRQFKIVLMIMVFMCVLTGCKSKYSSIPNKEEVMEKVNEVCPTEEFELVSVEDKERNPKKTVYTFQSKERDLSFEAVSTLSQESIDGGMLPWYYDEIYCDYERKIEDLYRDRVKEVYTSSSFYRDYDLHFQSYADIPKLSHAIAESNKIYQEELAYNEPEWLADRPIMYQRVFWTDKTFVSTNNDDVQVIVFAVDGQLSYDEIVEKLSFKYAQKIVEGLIPNDSTMPKERLESTKRSEITDIVICDTTLLSDKPYRDGSYNVDKKIIKAMYDRESDSYYMPIDVGLTQVECGPQLMAYYVETAGGICEVDYRKGKIKWTIGNDTYQLNATKSDAGYVGDVLIKKNSIYMGVVCKAGLIRATYLTAVSIEDLARMLGLSVRIEDETKIVFYK